MTKKKIYIYQNYEYISEYIYIYIYIYTHICISFLVGIRIGFENFSVYYLGFGGLIVLLPVLRDSDLDLFPSLFAS